MSNSRHRLLVVAAGLGLCLTAGGCEAGAKGEGWPFGDTATGDAATFADTPDVDGTADRREWYVRNIGVSFQHVCAVLEDRTVRCWGSGGTDPEAGSEELRRKNDELTPDGEFTEVAAGSGFACGLRTSGGLECWPQVATFGRKDFEAPVERGREIDAGAYGMLCVRRTDEELVQCWDTGTSSDDELEKSLGIAESPETFAVGRHLCATFEPPIAGGRPGQPKPIEMRCRTNEKITNDYLPPDNATDDFTDVGVEATRVCGIDQDGSVLCHAWAEDGSLGWLRRQRREGPYRQIELATSLRCAIRSDTGELECWGDSATGDVPANWDPLEVPDGEFTDVEVGSGQTVCGIRPDGRLECAGEGAPAPLK